MSRAVHGIALALGLCCGSAQAVVVNMGTDPVDQSIANNFASGSGSFSDVVLFSLSSARGLVSTAFSNWPVPTAGLRNLTLELFQGTALIASEGPSTVVAIPGSGIPAFTLESLSRPLAAGSYRLVLSGDVRPDGGFYSWSVSTTGAVAPVPEPEHWALMLAGLAAVGTAVRRQQRHKREA